MADIQTSTWSETAASNNATPPDGFPEGMNYSAINDSNRETMAAIKREWNRSHPTVSTGGTSTAMTLTYTTAPAAYVNGMIFMAKIATSCGETPTLNVNALGAKKVYLPSAAGPRQARPGDLIANNIHTFAYDTALDGGGGGFLVTDAPRGGWQDLAPQTASASSSIDFTIPNDAELIEFIAYNILPATNGANLAFRIDRGSGYLSGSIYLSVAGQFPDTGLYVAGFGGTDTTFGITGGTSTSTAMISRGTIMVGSPHLVTFQAFYLASGTATRTAMAGGGYITGSGDITGLRFLMSSGNIATGAFRCRVMR